MTTTMLSLLDSEDIFANFGTIFYETVFNRLVFLFYIYIGRKIEYYSLV